MIRLCVTGLRGVPNVMGGIEAHAQCLYPALKRLDPELEIIIYGRTPYIGSTPTRWQGLDVQPVWTVRQKHLETILHTFLSVLRARFVERPTILHIHGIGPALMAPLARLLGLTVIVTHHGHDYERMKWGPLARFVLRMGEMLMMATAGQIIAVGKSGAERLRNAYPSRARLVHHIPNGAALVDPAECSGAVLQDLSLDAGGYILSVGRLVPEKGFQDLIAAVQDGAASLPLVIVGAADHEDDFSRSLQKLAADSDVVLAGRRSRGELETLYRNARLFVLPSYHEGLPIAALEALRAGAPVLLSDIAPNRDLGLPSVNYFPVGDRHALAQRLDEPSFDDLRPPTETLFVEHEWNRIARSTHHLMLDLSRPGKRARRSALLRRHF